jgi:hypothetical protein
MTEKPSPWAGMSKEEILKNMPPFKKRPKKPEPKPEPKVIVELASCNPNVPLERQRERISEAQKRLIEDEDRRLKEWKAQKKHERWLAERQETIDWHWEQKLLNEEIARQYRDDPERKLFNETWGEVMKQEREANQRKLVHPKFQAEELRERAEREQRAWELQTERDA